MRLVGRMFLLVCFFPLSLLFFDIYIYIIWDLGGLMMCLLMVLYRRRIPRTAQLPRRDGEEVADGLVDGVVFLLCCFSLRYGLHGLYSYH